MEFRNMMVECLESDKLNSEIYTSLCGTVYPDKMTNYGNSDIDLVLLDEPQYPFSAILVTVCEALTDNYTAEPVMTYNIEHGICVHFNLDSDTVRLDYGKVGDFIDDALIPSVRRKLTSFNLNKTDISVNISNISDTFVHVTLKVSGENTGIDVKYIMKGASKLHNRLSKKLDSMRPSWFSSYPFPAELWDRMSKNGLNYSCATCTSKDVHPVYD